VGSKFKSSKVKGKKHSAKIKSEGKDWDRNVYGGKKKA
jgi:hypothetical protein